MYGQVLYSTGIRTYNKNKKRENIYSVNVENVELYVNEKYKLNGWNIKLSSVVASQRAKDRTKKNRMKRVKNKLIS